MATTLLQRDIQGNVVAPVRTFARRKRLSQVVGRRAHRDRPFIVSVHGPLDPLQPTDATGRDDREWRHTLLGKNEIVLITYLPRGGNTGALVGALALAALAFAVPFGVAALPLMVQEFAATAFLAKALPIGLIVGAQYFLSQAQKPKANDDGRPLYGVSGGGSVPRPGDRIPVGYGHFVTQPDLSQSDYTRYDGEDMLLHKRMTLGLGKYDVTKIMVGTSTFWTKAGGVQAPFNAGAQGSGVDGQGNPRGVGGAQGGSGLGTAVEIIAPGATSTLVPASVYSHPSVAGATIARVGDNPAFTGPFAVVPVGKLATRIQFDYSIAACADEAAPGTADWNVTFEIAPCDNNDAPTGAYTALHSFGELNKKFSRAKRYTAFADVAPGRYLIRAQNNQPQNDGVTNEVTWDGLRVHFPETITRPHVTEIAMRIRSSKALAVTSFSDVWVEATRILPVDDGAGGWVEEPTRKAVYAFKDILQASYGGNLADSEVDLAQIKSRAASLTQYDTFDGVIRGPVSVWEACSTVLGPMRGEPARLGTVWSLSRDEQKTVRKHVITRRQIALDSSTQSYKFDRSDGAADVIAEWDADADPRKRRELRVTFGSQTLTPRRIRLAGVRDYGHAHQLATWFAAVGHYRRKDRDLTTELQARILRRSDPARIDNWFIDVDRMAAGSTGYTAGTRTLSIDAPYTISGTRYVMIRDRRGREFGPIRITQGADAYQVVLDATELAAAETTAGQTIAAAMANSTSDQTSVLLGTFSDASYLIKSVDPQTRFGAQVSAVIDAPEVWAALGEAVPSDPGGTDDGGELVPPAFPVVPWVRGTCVQKSTNLVVEWSCGVARNGDKYVVMLSYDDGATWDRISESDDTSGSYPVEHKVGAAIAIRAYATDAHGRAGPVVSSVFATIKPIISGEIVDLRVTVDDLNAALQQKAGELAKYLDSLEKRFDEEASRFNEIISGLVIRGNETRDEIKAESGGTRASISVVRTLAVDVDYALAQYKVVTDVHLNGIDANVTTTQTALATLNAAFAGYQITVNSRLDAAEAGIGVNASALSTLSGAFADYQVAVNVRFGSAEGRLSAAEAGISTNATAIGTQTSALASLTTALSATYGSASALVTQVALVSANVDGSAGALWRLNLNVNGKVAGIRLGNSGSTSVLDIEADALRIGVSGALGFFYPFVFDAVNGWAYLENVRVKYLLADTVDTVNLKVRSAAQLDYGFKDPANFNYVTAGYPYSLGDALIANGPGYTPDVQIPKPGGPTVVLASVTITPKSSQVQITLDTNIILANSNNATGFTNWLFGLYKDGVAFDGGSFGYYCPIASGTGSVVLYNGPLQFRWIVPGLTAGVTYTFEVRSLGMGANRSSVTMNRRTYVYAEEFVKAR